ncbi:hypothetical protein [Nostoc sp.]|uniref:hypothetical protein n=1 Tax=Nostoc sp. TaxID=1180 RepID=UPI002FF5FAC2
MPAVSRLIRLTPWAIRVLILQGVIGVYTLFNNKPVYVGRFDFNVQARLLIHASNKRAKYFQLEVFYTPVQAFIYECAGFHAWQEHLYNRIHPDSPNGANMVCPFCLKNFQDSRLARFVYVNAF